MQPRLNKAGEASVPVQKADVTVPEDDLPVKGHDKSSL